MMDTENKNLIFASAVLVMLCDTKIRPEEIDSLKSEGKVNQLISSFESANQRIKETDIVAIFEEAFEGKSKQNSLISKSAAAEIIKQTIDDFSKVQNQRDLHGLANKYAVALKEGYREFATLICLFMAVIDREFASEEADVLSLFAKAWKTEELLNSSLHQMGLLDT